MKAEYERPASGFGADPAGHLRVRRLPRPPVRFAAFPRRLSFHRRRAQFLHPPQRNGTLLEKEEKIDWLSRY